MKNKFYLLKLLRHVLFTLILNNAINTTSHMRHRSDTRGQKK